MVESRPKIIYRYLQKQDYLTTWQQMREFTLKRNLSGTQEKQSNNNRSDKKLTQTNNQIWFTEHPPVFTLGRAGKSKHLLQTTSIPLIKTDRGGQITYHGPGQLIVYCLLNLQQLKLGVSQLVRLLEQLILAVLAQYQITGHLIKGAPGVYVEGKKIASIGLKVTRGCCHHGFAFNLDMDLNPFTLINPCGYSGLEVTHLKAWVQPGTSLTLYSVAKTVERLFDRMTLDGFKNS